MVLVDANVLLDILTADPQWAVWSAEKLAQGLALNPRDPCRGVRRVSHRDGIGGCARFAGCDSDGVQINVEQIFKLLSPETRVKSL